jgi:hypothetical protein
MNRSRLTMVVVFLLGLGMAQVASARWGGHGWGGHGWHDHGWGGNFDIVIGPPLGWGYYPAPYPYYYNYPPPVYLPPPQPPVYIEREPAEPAAPPAPRYWYYCTKPQGYYPTIKQCPGGWLKVVPQTR